MPITVCIITNTLRSEIEQTIRSYVDCCSEIILGFNGDITEVKNFNKNNPYPNVRLLIIEWKGYAASKNELAGLATNDWILSIDSDEIADEILQQSLRNFDPPNDYTLYTLHRENYFGEIKIKYGEWGRGNKNYVRLYNRNYTQWNNEKVHEQLESRTSAEIVKLPGVLMHYTATDEKIFVEKNKRYAALSAEKYMKQGRKFSSIKRYLSPPFTFIKEYVFLLGFLDGKNGFIIAKGNALYTRDKYKLLNKMKKNKK